MGKKQDVRKRIACGFAASANQGRAGRKASVTRLRNGFCLQSNCTCLGKKVNREGEKGRR